jgi:hypothetical protein
MSDSPYRPLYETEHDLKLEQAIANRIEQGFAWKLRKLSRKYYLDFMAFSKTARWNEWKAVATIEVKRRNHPIHRYATVILSLAKYLKGVEYHDKLGLDFYFIVQFDNGCFKYKYHNGDGSRLQITMGGRTDRNDPADIEPVIHIPVDTMTPLLEREDYEQIQS